MPAPRNADEATAIDSAILNIARPDVLSKKGNGETAKWRNSETGTRQSKNFPRLLLQEKKRIMLHFLNLIVCSYTEHVHI
jgi:hypothetical protein